jgi:hypothetical protein
MTASRKSPLFLASCILLGCTTADSEDAGQELVGGSQGTLALISIERNADPGAELPRVSAGAKVARYRGIDGAGLLKLLGAEPRDLETCSGGGALEERSVGATAQVDLLSVGPIALRFAESQHQLPPRLFPALATTAAGFFYAGAVELPAPSADNEEFALSAPGVASMHGLGKFELSGASPAEVHGLSLTGAALERGASLPRDADAELTWEAEGQGDRIEIEIFAGSGTLVCAARDDGHFNLPRARLKAMDADDNATLIVRRVRVLPVDMAGIDSAYARVSTARTLPLQIK